jgi:hypothetical protein
LNLKADMATAATCEVFEAVARSAGDLAGVYEFDGETGYFYLYQTGSNANKVLASIHVLSGAPDFTEADVEIRWDRENEKVGLFIREELWAVFDARDQTSYGGDYKRGTLPQVPSSVMHGFKFVS